MKKKLSILIALVMAISLCLVPAVAQAAVPPSPPTIDGVESSTEWQEAVVIQVADNMGTVKVIAYPDYLYMLFVVQDPTDNRFEEGYGNDKISVNINPDVSVGYECDIIFETGTDPAAWPIGPSCGPIDGYETNWVIDGVQVTTLPQELEAKTIYSADTRVTEWKIPLATITDLSPGDTLKLGGACDNLNNSGNSYRYPVGLDWGDVATYVDILVQANTAVGLTGEVETITAINVTPTSIKFGTLYPGMNSNVETITVENIGTVPVDVNASVSPTPTLFDNLTLDGGSLLSWRMHNLAMGTKGPVDAQVVVPLDYTSKGEETATLAFIATRVE